MTIIVYIQVIDYGMEKNCDSKEEACCNRPLIPWFHKKLGYTTNDYIEMRICFNEGTNDEDSPVEEYEIYVK